jgi:hypothetical protein
LSKHLFPGFYLDQLVDQPGDSLVQALLLLKVIVKEFPHMNSGDDECIFMVSARAASENGWSLS